MKKIIIFLGPPGSGKGTQAEKVAVQYDFSHLSSGDLLRNLLANPQNQAPEDLAEAQKMHTGQLVGDWLIYKLIFSEIEKNLSLGKGVVLDGAIRNLEQAREFIKFFQEKKLLNEVLVIYLRLSEQESLFRLTHRRVCSVCGLNIPYSKETQNLEVCPKCGGEIKQRFDDQNEQIFKTRLLEQGEKVLTPIAQEFKNINEQMVKELDGSQGIEDIFEEIKQNLKNAS